MQTSLFRKRNQISRTAFAFIRCLTQGWHKYVYSANWIMWLAQLHTNWSVRGVPSTMKRAASLNQDQLCHSKSILGQKACRHWIKGTLTLFFTLKEKFSRHCSQDPWKAGVLWCGCPQAERSALMPRLLTRHTDPGLLFIEPESQPKTHQSKAKLLPNLARHPAPLSTSVLIMIVFIVGFLIPH